MSRKQEPLRSGLAGAGLILWFLSETGIGKARHVISDLDTTVCRGLYLSAQNVEARLVQQAGSHVIVTARGMNYCWERFVFVARLRRSKGGNRQWRHVRHPASGPVGTNHNAFTQGEADYQSFWMAPGVLCR